MRVGAEGSRARLILALNRGGLYVSVRPWRRHYYAAFGPLYITRFGRR